MVENPAYNENDRLTGEVGKLYEQPELAQFNGPMFDNDIYDANTLANHINDDPNQVQSTVSSLAHRLDPHRRASQHYLRRLLISQRAIIIAMLTTEAPAVPHAIWNIHSTGVLVQRTVTSTKTACRP